MRFAAFPIKNGMLGGYFWNGFAKRKMKEFTSRRMGFFSSIARRTLNKFSFVVGALRSNWTSSIGSGPISMRNDEIPNCSGVWISSQNKKYIYSKKPDHLLYF